MTFLMVLFVVALVTPVLGRLLCRRPGGRPRPLHGRALLAVLAVSAACWIALAWNTTVPHAVGETWDAVTFFLIAGVGIAWVEVSLLFGRRGWTPEPTADGGLTGPEPVSEEDDDAELPSSSRELPEEAKQLLDRALDLSALSAERIMTPRKDLVTVEAGTSIRETLARMREAERSRVLVIEGSIDRIVGVAHAKDLARLAVSSDWDRPVRGVARRLLRLPRRVPTSRLIQEFQQARVSIGVVGDARGRTLGLVTRGDVFRFVASGAMREKEQG
ncbi:MAG: CBS domain-containing protein [Candidatus Eisenbacteria bacterium]|uniref:CBS domain-containing protein n=1 Tax=Eiseniibacteriota bacterium TaxID=2212470 RepID=A0A956LW79_UNCEI|nr:CBS domain-containing protein [Candidatus Eisenbacteria bacterium]